MFMLLLANRFDFASFPETSVSDPAPVGSAFNLGLDPGSGSYPDPDSGSRCLKIGL
jgi:hypothetical protein